VEVILKIIGLAGKVIEVQELEIWYFLVRRMKTFGMWKTSPILKGARDSCRCMGLYFSLLSQVFEPTK